MKRQYIKDYCLKYEYKVLNVFNNITRILITKLFDTHLKILLLILNTIGTRMRYIEKPSNYDSINQYLNDQFNAKLYIYSDEKVPKQLAKKLVKARKQLERRGVLETYNSYDAEYKERKRKRYDV